MKLTVDQIRDVTCGAVSVTEEQDGIHLFRFTKEQMDLYEARDPGFYSKTLSSAGMCLRFHTDSTKLFLQLQVVPQSGSRRYFSIEFFVNGICVDSIENFSDVDLSGDYTAIPLPTGEFSKNVRLGKGEKEVCVYLPWNMNTVIKVCSLDDDASVVPVKPEKKLLCFGDSITQGYDALRPSHRYTSKLAACLNAEEYSKAIGGEFFWPALANTKEGFIPDYITVAYGTNDWSRLPYETFQNECKAFYENLSKNYPNTPIFAITPIWRADTDRTTDFPNFEVVECYIREVAEPLSNVMVISGFDLVPHDTKFFADLYLHPNDFGFGKYYKNIKKHVKTKLKNK